MKPRILLINPWIHDFAAYNLWARPLGLLTVAGFLSSFDADLRLLDCMDAWREGRYGIGKYPSEIIPRPALLSAVPRRYKRYGIGIEEFRSRLKAARPFDIVLITSVMTYWYPGVQQAAALVREEAGSVPIILGGTYPTLYPDHASRRAGVDMIYGGRVDDRLLSLVSHAGLRLEKARPPVPQHRMSLYQHHAFVPLLTSQGCPFHCSYCASRTLVPVYERRQATEVLDEIRAWHALGVRDFAFYDDALLYEPDLHIKPLLQGIIEAGLQVRLHAPNGLHARFVDDELARLMKAAGFATIRLSLETIDSSRQRATGGKVSTADFERSLQCLRKQGFGKEQIGVYLLYGLPRQGLDEVEKGVRFLAGLDVRIQLAEFSPLPGTSSWKELVQAEVISDDLDPLLTNNTVFSYLNSGYDHARVSRLKIRVKEYNAS